MSAGYTRRTGKEANHRNYWKKKQELHWNKTYANESASHSPDDNPGCNGLREQRIKTDLTDTLQGRFKNRP
jgi:hypothetical protein